MNLLILPGCLFGRHRRDRRTVFRDGNIHRGKCAGCGRPMIRDFKGWRLDDGALDDEP